MRFLFPMLLLSAATPALARPVDSDARPSRSEQRQERAERPQPRFERPAPPQFQPPQSRPQPQPQGQFEGGQRRFEGGRGADAGGGQRWRDRRPDQPNFPPAGVAPAGRPGSDSVADWRWRDRRGAVQPGATAPSPVIGAEGAPFGARDRRDPNRDRWRGRDGRQGDGGLVGRPDRDGRRDGNWTGRDGRDGRYNGGDWRNGRRDVGGWSRDWRRDPRYDWQRYRDRNRSIFRIGAYIDPFGWGYRSIGIGYQLYPNYYADQYWLSDPSYYSLPLVSWPYRWVRYYDDALLIDVRDGRVVDAIQSFFW